MDDINKVKPVLMDPFDARDMGKDGCRWPQAPPKPAADASPMSRASNGAMRIGVTFWGVHALDVWSNWLALQYAPL